MKNCKCIVFLSYFLLTFFVFLPFSVSADHVKDNNVFHSPGLGFKITKVESWAYMSAKSSRDYLEQAVTRKKLSLKNVSLPLVTISKLKGTVRPSLEVRARSLRGVIGLNPKDMMNKYFPLMIKKYKNVEILQKPIKKEFSGLDASYFKFKSILRLRNGNTFPVVLEQWLVFSNNIYFIITGSYIKAENKKIADELHMMVNSIIINP